MKKVICLCFVIFLISCNTKQEESVEEVKLIQVAINKKSSSKSISNFIDKISSIRLVPLETNDESVTTIHEVKISNDIFIIDEDRTVIHRFDKKGNFLNKIERLGQGPEEYNSISSMFVKDEYIY